MYNFSRRRDQLTIDKQTVYLIEPLEEAFQEYEQHYLGLSEDDPDKGVKLKKARIQLCLITLCDESGELLVETDKLTELEVNQWPVHVTKAIEKRAMALTKEHFNQEAVEELGKPTEPA